MLHSSMVRSMVPTLRCTEFVYWCWTNCRFAERPSLKLGTYMCRLPQITGQCDAMAWPARTAPLRPKNSCRG